MRTFSYDKVLLAHSLYWYGNRTMREIAFEFNTSAGTLRRAFNLFDFDIKRKGWAKNPVNRNGSNNPKWRGGRVYRKGGHVRIFLPDYPKADKSGYVLEHVYIAEQVLGRPLVWPEVVHHINGDGHDNRKCNLLICTQGYHMWLHHHAMKRKKLL